jgi:hypothetical protein
MSLHGSGPIADICNGFLHCLTRLKLVYPLFLARFDLYVTAVSLAGRLVPNPGRSEVRSEP